jgi:hypothetical protein
MGARTADRCAAREGHGASLTGGDAWRNATPEAWGRARGVGARCRILRMRRLTRGGVDAEVEQTPHGDARQGRCALERRVPAAPLLAFDLALFDREKLQNFEL